MTKIYNHTAMLLVSSLLLGGCSGNETNKQDTTYITNTQNTNTTIEDNVTDTNTTQQITTYVDNNVTITPQSVDTNETQTEDNTTTSDTNTTDMNDTSVTEGNDENTTQQTNTEIKALKLTIQKSTLNKDTNTTLKVEALYKNNTKEDVTTKVEWIEDKKGIVSIYDHTLTAKEDKDITLQAKLDNKTSNPIKLHIYWKVNNHTLPPEPDPKVNNSTLLGIDSNNNGVRDDVERWIYNKYKDKHPIYIDIAMQAARGYRLVLEKQPRTKTEAMSIMKDVERAIYCEMYYSMNADEFNEPLLVQEDIDTKYFRHKIYFDTKDRMNIYIRYDSLFSGDSYTLPRAKDRKAMCDFNTSKYDNRYHISFLRRPK